MKTKPIIFCAYQKVGIDTAKNALCDIIVQIKMLYCNAAIEDTWTLSSHGGQNCTIEIEGSSENCIKINLRTEGVIFFKVESNNEITQEGLVSYLQRKIKEVFPISPTELF